MIHQLNSSLQVGPLQPLEQNETPIKKIKGNILEQGTAESQSKKVPSIQDIDPEELFENFSDIVKITEQDPEIEEQYSYIQRKLQYEHSPTMKLSFEPKSSSMKKKHKVGYGNQPQTKVNAINLFKVETQKALEQQGNKMQAVYMTPVSQKTSMKGLDETPMKKGPGDHQ